MDTTHEEQRWGAARYGAAKLLRAGIRRAASGAPPGWDVLERELVRWQPGTVRLWWRDDDATTSTPALDRLLALRARLRVPLALAVIPATADPALAACLPGDVAVLVHGWNHADHSRPGEPKSELAPGRHRQEVLDQLRAGLAALAGTRLLPVLVPPFNQLAPGLVPVVRQAGFTHVSVDRDFPGFGIPSINVHADVVDWGRGTGQAPAELVRGLVMALRLRRMGLVSRAAPIGVMTHHLAHDETAWGVSEELLERLAHNPAIRFPELPGLFNAE